MTKAYTDEEAAYIAEEYTKDPTRDTVLRLASEMEKSARSVTSKLSKMGVYKRAEYRSKTGTRPYTKEQMVEALIEKMELNRAKMENLDKAPRSAIQEIIETFEALTDIEILEKVGE